MKNWKQLFLCAAVSSAFAMCAKSGDDAGAGGSAVDCGNIGRVTYNPNGATSGTVPRDQCVGGGSIFYVGGNDGNLARTGYVFQGWNGNAAGTGVAYSGSYQALNNGTLTLYAKWKAAYSVTYDGNGNTGGTPPTDANNYVQASSVTTLKNPGGLIKTGSAFAGWNTNAAGTGTNYMNGATFSIGGANVILYAKWDTPYTITYDGNSNTGGSAPSDSNVYASGISVTTQGNTGALARTGFAFGGWNTQANGSGVNYIAGLNLTMGAANLTLYAKWNTLYTVSYDGNSNTGGTAPTDANTYTQGATVTSAANTGALTRNAYTFSGWNTLANGSGTTYNPPATFVMGAANLTLYAQWAPNNRAWNSVASSSDGTKLAAVVSSGQIYTSIDSGVTWTARDSSRSWKSVASSSDGTKLVAVVSSGQIYTSIDSGVTWTARDSSRQWWSVASSSDGTKLVAVVYSGQIYTSGDSGVTWTARDSIRNWWSVTSSSDGTKLVAVVSLGQIYTSIDSGVTWTARDSSRGWWSVASSSDGTKLVAVVYSGQIYTSGDSGVTWTARDSIRNWYCVASSSDGTKLVAGLSTTPGQIYTSTDSGVTWTARDSSRNWYSVASSSDGTKLVAVVNNGLLYTSTDSGVTWQAQF